MDFIDKIIIEKIRSLKKEDKNKLAKAVGVSIRTIDYWLEDDKTKNNKRNPSKKKYEAIANFFGFSSLENMLINHLQKAHTKEKENSSSTTNTLSVKSTEIYPLAIEIIGEINDCADNNFDEDELISVLEATISKAKTKNAIKKRA